MKSRMLKMISLAVTAVMLLLSFPFTGFSEIAQASEKTAEEFSANTYVAGRLQLLFDRLVYGDNPFFTTTGQSCGNTHCDECALKAVCAEHPDLKDLGISYDGVTAYGSAAFARFGYTVIFGKALTTVNLYGNTTTESETQRIGRVASNDTGIIGDYDAMTEENLRAIMKKGTAGDIIQARSSRGVNHTMIFLKYDGEGVWVLHSVDFGDKSEDYNRVVISMYTYAEMMEKWDRVISLMRADKATYTATYSKGETKHETHTYTDEGGNNCVICGEAFVPTVSTAEAGVYKAQTDADVYYNCYRSMKIEGMQIDIGKFVEVVGSVENALGVTFYITTGASYVCAEDFASQTANVPVFTMEQYPSAVWTYGEGCLIVGTVRFSKNITKISGFIASAAGDVVQKQSIETASNEVAFASTAINRLTFGTLPEGNYVFLMTAVATDGSMGCFSTEFEVRRPLIKPTPETPSAPTLKEKTDTTVRLVQNAGYEYKINDGEWQTSAAFTGLQPAMTYDFYRRTAETDTYKPSEASPALTVKTDKSSVSAPAAPTLKDKTDTTVTLNAKAGEEYSIDNGATWQTTGLFSGLNPGENYRFIARCAATATTYASPASAALNVRTEKSSVPAPAAPTLAERTEKTIRINTTQGLEYSIDGGNTWQTSGLFSGLNPGVEYRIVARVTETDTTFASLSSEALFVRTDKDSIPAPAVPTVAQHTNKSITVNTLEGLEYSINGGKNWQTSGVFEGLTPGTEYKIIARRAETDATFASPVSGDLTVKTDRSVLSAPGKPELSARTDVTVTLKAQQGIEYSADGGKTWQTSGVFIGLEPGTNYSFIARYAESERNFASDPSAALTVKTDKSNPAAPTRPELASIIGYKVTVIALEGLEYKLGEGAWQSSGTFEVETYGDYRIYARKAETDKNYAGPSSGALVVTVGPLSLTSDAVDVFEDKLIVSDVATGATVGALFELFPESGYMTVCDEEGKTLSSDTKVYTGMRLVLSGGKEYRLAVRGDANGDGQINVFDLTKLKNEILSGEELKGAYYAAADVNGDGSVNVFDYVLIKNGILSGEGL